MVRALDQLIEIRGRPQVLRSDNGPEFISEALARWARRHGVELRFIQPGKPMQYGVAVFMCSRRVIPQYFQSPR